jgi:subtilisin family serine protease
MRCAATGTLLNEIGCRSISSREELRGVGLEEDGYESSKSSSGVRILLAVVLLAVGMLPAVAARHGHPATPDPQVRLTSSRPLFTRSTLLVGLGDGGLSRALGSLSPAVRRQVAVLDRLSDLGLVRIRVPEDHLDALMHRLDNSGAVRFVECEGMHKLPRSRMTRTSRGPDRTCSTAASRRRSTQAPKAWDGTTGSAAVTVAVVDSGIDDAHPDLAGNVVAGTSIVGGLTTDTHGHGEYVAGVIAPNMNNGPGVAANTSRRGPSRGPSSRDAPVRALDARIRVLLFRQDNPCCCCSCRAWS